MTILRRALLRATLAAFVTGCTVAALIGFTNPVMFHAVIN